MYGNTVRTASFRRPVRKIRTGQQWNESPRFRESGGRSFIAWRERPPSPASPRLRSYRMHTSPPGRVALHVLKPSPRPPSRGPASVSRGSLGGLACSPPAAAASGVRDGPRLGGRGDESGAEPGVAGLASALDTKPNEMCACGSDCEPGQAGEKELRQRAGGLLSPLPLGGRGRGRASRRDGRLPGFARRFRWRESGPSPNLSPLAGEEFLYQRSWTGTDCGSVATVAPDPDPGPHPLNVGAHTAGRYRADALGSAPFAPLRQVERARDGPRLGGRGDERGCGARSSRIGKHTGYKPE